LKPIYLTYWVLFLVNERKGLELSESFELRFLFQSWRREVVDFIRARIWFS
jgi:hypothetical protein